jgi:hypothetical protein
MLPDTRTAAPMFCEIYLPNLLWARSIALNSTPAALRHLGGRRRDSQIVRTCSRQRAEACVCARMCKCGHIARTHLTLMPQPLCDEGERRRDSRIVRTCGQRAEACVCARMCKCGRIARTHLTLVSCPNRSATKGGARATVRLCGQRADAEQHARITASAPPASAWRPLPAARSASARFAEPK